MPLTHDDLRVASLARQFPTRPPSDPAELLATSGPIQSQTARSTFLGLAARTSGLTHAGISEGFETGVLLRGSTIRGTVHTMSPEHQRVLDAVTRAAQRTFWRRALPLRSLTLEEIWSALEAYAWQEWRSAEELRVRLRQVLEAGHEHAAVGALGTGPGRSLGVGHGGLVRRPRSGGWEGQGGAGYRAAEAISGLPRLTTEDAIRQAVLLHVRRHGPSSRQDLAWWSGLGLRVIDAAVAELGDDLIRQDGADGRVYLEVPDAPEPHDLPGVVLLPEFDALLCGYDSKARDRFITPEHHARIWSQDNGLLLPPVLVDGRITGYWRMTGSARTRPVEVHWFSRTRRPRKAELAEPIARIEAALGITVSELSVMRA